MGELWEELLPEHRIVAVVRHPSELWAHYSKQSFLQQTVQFFLIGWKATCAWYVYNAEILKIRRSTKLPVYCCEYSEFMNRDDVFERLCRLTGNRSRIAAIKSCTGAKAAADRFSGSCSVFTKSFSPVI